MIYRNLKADLGPKVRGVRKRMSLKLSAYGVATVGRNTGCATAFTHICVGGSLAQVTLVGYLTALPIVVGVPCSSFICKCRDNGSTLHTLHTDRSR
jgi:hypothetical protein